MESKIKNASCNQCGVSANCCLILRMLAYAERAMLEVSKESPLRRRWEELVAELESNGWSYPFGVSPCRLTIDMELPEQVIAELDDFCCDLLGEVDHPRTGKTKSAV